MKLTIGPCTLTYIRDLARIALILFFIRSGQPPLIISMKNSLRPQTHTSLGKYQQLTISQALSAFAQTLERKNNYLPVARNYLRFTVEHDLLLNDFSRDRYFFNYSQDRKLGYNISSPVRKFLRFATQAGIQQVVADPPQNKVPPAANELILGYLSSAKNLRGQKTKLKYTNALNVFFRWLEQEQRPFFFPSVSAYVDFLIGENRSPFTINFYLSVIKQLAKWVVKQRKHGSVELSGEQLESLRDIQYIRGLVYERTYYKESLTSEQREHLRQSIDDPLWRSVISLMSYSGLRSVEIPRLRMGDVDLEQHTVNVKGKGKYSYEMVRLIGASQQDVATCLKQRLVQEASRESEKKKSPLYPTITAESQVQYQVKKYLQAAGLAQDKLSSHSLRHTAAQLLIDRNVNPVYVQQQLRHSTFEVTQFYVRKTIKKKFLDEIDNIEPN